MQQPQSVQRQEELGLESRSQISLHQYRGLHLSRLSAVMVVQLGLSWLEDDVLLLMRVSLRGSHSRSHRQQSILKRDSRQRRQSRHLSHSFAALVIPML